MLVQRHAVYSQAMGTLMNAGFKNNEGFTLVELAIVMTIIGLLIGGILKGQELMMNARLTGTIKQVQSYQSAVIIFRDSFDYLPGDFARAQFVLPNCSIATSCYNGNGDSFIGTDAFYYAAVDSISTSENAQFWMHLMRADMISGIDGGSPASPQFGRTHPAAPLNGGFHVRFSTLALGNSIMLRGTADGTWSFNGPKALSPKNAALIDRKMDDGMALTGSVYGYSFGLSTGCGYNSTGTQGPAGYDERMLAEMCDMNFKL